MSSAEGQHLELPLTYGTSSVPKLTHNTLAYLTYLAHLADDDSTA